MNAVLAGFPTEFWESTAGAVEALVLRLYVQLRNQRDLITVLAAQLEEYLAHQAQNAVL